jgi:type IV pilus assembly protein PilY1
VCPGGSCTGRWLVDRECKLITPDKTGFLYQATWNGTALIVPPPAACTTNADCGGKTCNVVTKTCPPNAKPAVPVWDAAEQIRQTNWYQRSVYTAIDTNNDGVINSSDGDISSPAGMYLITAGAVAGNKDLSGGVSDVVADALAPYMALDGPTTCGDIEVKLGTSFPAATPRLRACARAVLNYALGEDLLNEYQIAASDANYRIINRIGMLGDVFHSSPQDIGPPINESDCTTGINTRRCVTTLFNNKPTNGLPDYQPLEKPGQVADPASGVMVANTANVDAYQAYYLDETFRLKRPRAMVFGANDGMLHAIQTACFVKATTSGGVTTAEYWDGPGMGSCIAGSQPNGSELWGFIAPDLLPKLALMMLGKHQFFVDGSPMVRDIYAPTGTAASTKRYTNTAPATMDFKRIAIFGEREGGTHWFGLDVTDPTWPSFRWTFPQPNTADELSVGQSWGDWVPNAPPIVPVRIAAPTPSTGFPTYLDSSGLAQAFQEKWVVLLPGGYDPYGAAGKRIYMLDAYSGQKIFQTNDTATIKQDFSFAALPSAIAWGTQVLANPPTYNNGYFDTAVYGDMGGQIWTLRFNDVGTMTAGLVSNWNFGRAFRQFAAEDTGSAPYKMQHRTPVFSMISAARMSEGALRVFLGTGDRANAGENGLGQCSIYNPLACGKNKCVMTTATNAWLGATGSRSPEMSTTSSFQGDIGATYTSSTTNTFTSAAAVCSPAVTEVNSCVSCANATTGNKAATPASPGEPQYACTNTSTGWKCSVRTISETLASDRLEAATGTLTPDPNGDIGYFSRFLGFNLFDNNLTKPRAIFTATATTYDTNALTETSLTDLFAANTPKTFSASGNTSVSAKVNGLSNGFYFSYPVLDERTATNSLLLQNCLSWYTIQPGQECMTNADCSSGTCNTTTHTCVAPVACGSSSTVIPARTAFLYQINASDGSTNCGLTSSTYIRTAAPLNSFLVPPPPPQQLVSTNKSGQMQFSIIAPAGQLSPSASAASGGASTPFSFFYTLGMPRELEQCRHTSSANACY